MLQRFVCYIPANCVTLTALQQQVPLYALLLFGGQVSVNHVAGGISIVSKDTQIKLKAWPRIGILVNQLR